MFKKIDHTVNAPSKHIFIWDGTCGFCKFWKTRWEAKTRNCIAFKTYQDYASKFPDIPLKEFQKASRLIETDGKIYSGPDSAYRSLWHTGKQLLHNLYKSSMFFRSISDRLYNHIAKNRGFYFKVTKVLFGTNPLSLKPYWVLYLIFIIILILV